MYTSKRSDCLRVMYKYLICCLLDHRAGQVQRVLSVCRDWSGYICSYALRLEHDPTGPIEF